MHPALEALLMTLALFVFLVVIVAFSALVTWISSFNVPLAVGVFVGTMGSGAYALFYRTLTR
jgi:preprotein translocase subunit SecF